MRQRLLLVITKGVPGGGQQYVATVAKHMQDHYDVHVAYGNGKVGSSDFLAETLRPYNIPIIHLSRLHRDIKPKDDLISFWDIYRLIRRVKPHIVHFNSSKAGIIGVFMTHLNNILHPTQKARIIFTAHGWVFNEQRNLFERLIFYILQVTTVLFSHHTIAVALRVKRQMPVFLYSKITVIYNARDSISYLKKPAARSLLYPYDTQSLFIGSVAELNKNKGIDLAIRAISVLHKNYPHIQYIVVGEGEERSVLEHLIQTLNAEDYIHLVGYHPNAAHLMKAFDIFLLPSRTEAFPYVLVEAGFAGVPIVATNVGGVSELISHLSEGVLIRKTKKSGITQALTYALSHKHELQVMSDQLMVKLQQHFSEKKMISETLLVYGK